MLEAPNPREQEDCPGAIYCDGRCDQHENPVTPDLAAVVAKVLAAHEQVTITPGLRMCLCGDWTANMPGGSPGDDARHRAHVAAEQAKAVSAALEVVRAGLTDLWRATPCGCGHRADLHKLDEGICIGGLTLCECRYSYTRILQERVDAALSALTPDPTRKDER